MRTSRAAWGAVAACLVVAGCGSGSGVDADATTAAPPAAGSRLATPDPASGQMLPASGADVARLLADVTGEPLVALAYVVVSPDGAARLCTALAESFPPQCGGPSIPVTGLPPEMVDGLSVKAGVRWSEGPVQLIGTVRGGVFVNDPAALAAS